MSSRWHNDQEPVRTNVCDPTATAGAMPTGIIKTRCLKHRFGTTLVFIFCEVPGVAIQGIHTFSIECAP
eukprot:7416098-Prorocentrum_lima.AAC.1